MILDWTQLLIALLGGGGLGALVSYLTSRHQAALERGKIEQQVERDLWERTREEFARLTKRVDVLDAENEALRHEVNALSDKNEELERQVASLRVENDTLRQSNAALKDELQLARLAQEEANKRHLDSLNELLVANSMLERELREVRGRMRKVEANTGPLQ